jgi:hypothetical protein
MSSKAAWGIIILIMSTIIFIGTCTTRIVSNIHFDQNCGGHLKRAADANTIELAKEELAISLAYMERENLTSGYTSVIYKTPDEDIGFWYKNILASHDELFNLSPDATSLEKSNMLIKLRETLLDKGERSEDITCPDGIGVYPFNTLYAVIIFISTLGIAIPLCGIVISQD